MADYYYLYDPADNLALGQAIILANADGGMSYIVPFANKSGVVDPADPASAGLGVIETAIAGGPLHPGTANTPVTNRLTATEFKDRVSPSEWEAIKAMMKSSIGKAPPVDWTAASFEAPDSTYSVISAEAYSLLQTKVFSNGAWTIADSSGRRGNPFIALGGLITDAVFVDYGGHYVPTANMIGEVVVDPSGQINNGTIYNPPPGSLVTAFDDGDPAYGLGINAPNKDVIIVNFSATSIGFGPSNHLADSLGLAGVSPATGNPLAIKAGRVTLAGDLVIDQVVQVRNGTIPLRAPITISGADSQVTISEAKVLLGATRGYQSLIDVHDNASLLVDASTIYGFSSSNSNAPLLPGDGLDWPGFVNTINGSAVVSHLLSANNGGSIKIRNSDVYREEIWQPQTVDNAYYDNLNAIYTPQVFQWGGNDYGAISDGDLHVGAGSKLELLGSYVLASVVADQSSNLSIYSSVVAGSPVGETVGSSNPQVPVSLVQLKGATATLTDSLVDSLDAVMLGGGSLSQSLDTHILSTNTGSKVSLTSDPTYTALASFAGPSSQRTLMGWADKENAATGNRAVFLFKGPTTPVQQPSGISRSLSALLTEAALPHIEASGATLYSLTARFQQAVSGFDTTDLQAALGSAPLAAGWTVSQAPQTNDGGTNWSFQLRSPGAFSTAVPLQLAAGAATSTLVSGLVSSASNSFSLEPVGGGSGGGSFTSVRATRGIDVLTGTAANDRFVFPNFYTGKPTAKIQFDRILNYGAGDLVDIQYFNDVVMGAPRGTRTIGRLAGTATELTVPAIQKALGSGFTGFRAAMIGVQGYGGSFLVVNNSIGGFGIEDMVVHLEGFTPTSANPLVLA